MAVLHRRHLDTSQRAMVGARAEKLRARFKEEAKERQKEHGGTAPGKAKSLQAGLPEVKVQSRDQLAEVVGVSGRTLDKATKVLKEAVPEVVVQQQSGGRTLDGVMRSPPASPAQRGPPRRADPRERFLKRRVAQQSRPRRRRTEGERPRSGRATG